MDIAKTPQLYYESKLQESEKAFQIKFDSETVCWLPKSQVRLLGNIIFVPQWLVNNKELKPFLVNGE